MNERIMTCFRCGKVDKEELFIKQHRTIDGLRGLCKECKSKADKKYRDTHKEKIVISKHLYWENNVNNIKEKNRRTIDLKRTGMTAEQIAGCVCERCGISNEESIKRYGLRLSVHHKNNNGRHNINNGYKPEHENLQILCCSCHTTIGNLTHRDYSNQSEVLKKGWETRRKRKADLIAKNKNSL